MRMVNAAQHARHISILQLATTIGDRLVQQAQAIPHTAVGGPGDTHDRGFFRWY